MGGRHIHPVREPRQNGLTSPMKWPYRLEAYSASSNMTSLCK
nr:MAG TPA: hypothetical protein [Caudoviricetes sp.]